MRPPPALAIVLTVFIGTGTNAIAQIGYYTDAQAARGKALFDRHCAQCHAGEPFPPGPRPDPGDKGFVSGRTRVYQSLAAPYLKTMYLGKPVFPSAYFLYKRIEGQPPADTTSVTVQQRVDIIAFLLKANGLPPGPLEIPPSPGVLRNMILNEDGFEPLFNGRDYTGIKFLLGPNCRPAPAGCGRTDPGNVFTVKDGVLASTGRVHGYWYLEKPYLNFTLRFEYRFDVVWPDEEDLFIGNSGTLLFVNDHVVWPTAIEIDGAHRTNLRANGIGTRIKATEDVEARKRARRPIGQWQSVEIRSSNGEIRAWLNGALITVVLEHEMRTPGYIAFQSQGTPIQWRNIRIKPE